MPRPPLPIGTSSNITTHQLPGGIYCAVARFRDHDGVTRKVKRTGKTAALAKTRLREDLRDRAQQGSASGLTGDTRFRVVAEEWMAGVVLLVQQGNRSPNTAQIYRLNLDTHVLPGIGELRVREVTVPRLDRFIQTLLLHNGTATAKLARTVISGVMGLAVRHGAVNANPARDIGRINSTPRRPPRALTTDERQRWIARLNESEDARRKELPDFCEWMLGTGVRIGEALAVSWEEINIQSGTVEISYTLIRIKGVGLLRKSTKTSAGERTLRLPEFAVAMLRRRELASGGRGPLFPDSVGGWRDPSNTSRDLRSARGAEEFAWVTSHVFRKTAATEMDRAGLSAREIADHLGHARISMTQDRYLGRRAASDAAASALDGAYRQASGGGDREVSGP